MVALIFLFLNLVASSFKSKSRLEAENAALRHQLTVLQRKARGRVQLTNSDRLFFIQLYRWFPSVLKAITIIRPATIVRWHRAGFRRYWRWKSRCLGGRPQINADLRAVCAENLVRIDPVTESPHVGDDGRADIPLFEPGCLAVQVQEPTRSGECRAEASADRAAAKGTRSCPVDE